MSKTRVLIVDDSPTMCAILSKILEQDHQIEVVATAADPYEARESIRLHKPHVLTLDVQMERMNGLVFLDKIMRLRPLPCIMISSLTQKGGDVAMKALELGAFECIAKPSDGQIHEALSNLPSLVKAAGMTRLDTLQPKAKTSVIEGFNRDPRKIVVIGSSTGGVDALSTVVSALPSNCPPVLITQHMSPGYTASFARRLNGKCAPTVIEAQEGMRIEAGHVYIAPSGPQHMRLSGKRSMSISVQPGEPVSSHAPSVDVLFESVAHLGKRVVAVMLTGMGSDGAQGMKAIRDAGGSTFGQDEESSVVFGMARVAHERGAVQRLLPLSKISAAILAATSKSKEPVT